MRVLLSELKFYEYATSRFEDLEVDEFERLKRDMELRGQQVPIIIDQENFILDGRQRVRAAVKLGWKEIEAIPLELDDDSRKETAVKVNVLRRHLSKQSKLKLLAEYYEPIREKNLKKKATNLRQVGQNVAGKKVNKIKGSPEMTNPVISVQDSRTKMRKDIQDIGKEKGVEVSSSEADQVAKIVAQAKKEGKTIAEVMTKSPEAEKPKTNWERFQNRIAEDLKFRHQVFEEVSKHSQAHAIHAHELPLRLKIEYNASKPIWIISL